MKMLNHVRAQNQMSQLKTKLILITVQKSIDHHKQTLTMKVPKHEKIFCIFGLKG